MMITSHFPMTASGRKRKSELEISAQFHVRYALNTVEQLDVGASNIVFIF